MHKPKCNVIDLVPISLCSPMKIKTGSGQLLLNVLGKSDVCTWPTRHYQHLVITKLRTLHYSSWLTGSTYFAPPISLWWKTSWHDKWRPVMSWANPNVQNFDNFHLLFLILPIYRLLINFHFLLSYPPNLAGGEQQGVNESEGDQLCWERIILCHCWQQASNILPAVWWLCPSYHIST